MPNMTGALPSGRHRLAGATPFRPLRAVPAQWGFVAPAYSYWLNNQYGICVTAEECANIAQFTAARGLPETIITDAEAKAWAKKHGFLNGANIAEVMDAMQDDQADGLTSPGVKHYDGPYLSIDWHDRAILCAAIYESQSCVKIGIASSCLGDAVQGKNGWIVLDARKNRNIDHCVALCGYGPLSYLCSLCGVAVPSGADPARFCYLMFTWSTVGIVSEEAMQAMTGEAWLRRPSSIADPPYPGPGPTPPPPPDPGPNPPPVPPVPPGPSPDWGPWVKFLLQVLAWLLRQQKALEARPIPEAAEAVAEAAEEIRKLAARINAFLDTLPK